MPKEKEELPEEPPKIYKYGLDEDSKIKYEDLLVQLNRELSRLRSLFADCEKREIECKEHNADKLHDYDDIIIYLTRTIRERSEELAELQEEKRKLEKIRNKRHYDYEQEIIEMENEYYTMVKTLTDENIALSNRILSLDRIKIERDAFFTKWEIQEVKLVSQYYRHKQEIYDLEKWVIIQKNKLKIEISENMDKLWEDFDSATELRLASLTYQLIKQNIVCNNFLQKMLERFEDIYAVNTKLRDENSKLNAILSANNSEYEYCNRKFKLKMEEIERLIRLFEEKFAIDEVNREFFKRLRFFVKMYIPSVEDQQKMQTDHNILLFLIGKEQAIIHDLHKKKCGLQKIHEHFRTMIKKTHKDLMQLFNNNNLQLKKQDMILVNIIQKLREVFTKIQEDEIMRSSEGKSKIHITAEKDIQTSLGVKDSVLTFREYAPINY